MKFWIWVGKLDVIVVEWTLNKFLAVVGLGEVQKSILEQDKGKLDFTSNFRKSANLAQDNVARNLPQGPQNEY